MRLTSLKMKSSHPKPFLFDISSVRVQDVVAVLAFLLGVFVFRVPDSYDLNPTWRLEIRLPKKHERNFMPQPIITDLDSDGINEFILVTGDSKIQIMAMPPGHSTEQHSLPHLHLKAETLLESVNPNLSSPSPVALASGCLKNLNGPVPYKTCHQVIVVVSNEGDVLCYNHHLQLQWKTRVVTQSLLTNAYFKEATALVSSRSLDINDEGLVVVGVRLNQDLMKSGEFQHNHQFNSSTVESAESIINAPPHRRAHHPFKQSADSRDHFSTYALDGKTGNLKWKHEAEDFKAKMSAKQRLLSSYHFKLALHSNDHHTSEVHWSQYTGSLLSSLPYRWQHTSHTKLRAAYFVKSSHSNAAREKDPISFGLNFLSPSSIDTQPKPTIGTKPNALVIHHLKGIEVLSLLSGQPLCRYKVKETVGDVNNDDVIDHVTSHFTSEVHHMDIEVRPCSAVVTSNSEVLFTGSICEAAWSLGSYFTWSDEERAQEPLAVAPLLVRSPAHRSGVLRHLMGHNVRKLRRSYDSVFLTSVGKVTSFGPHGELNWQVKTDARWRKQVSFNEHESRDTHVAGRGESFFPDVEAAATKVGGTEDAVLVSGWSHFAMLSLRDGSILSSHSLPCQPVSPVIQGDFTNDGLTDVVVHCRDGYLGFALSRHPRHWWTVLWAACVLGIVLVAVCVLRFIEDEIL